MPAGTSISVNGVVPTGRPFTYTSAPATSLLTLNTAAFASSEMTRSCGFEVTFTRRVEVEYPGRLIATTCSPVVSVWVLIGMVPISRSSMNSFAPFT